MTTAADCTRWLRVSEASAMFGLHPATIRKACDSGRLPCGRFGVRRDRRLRIDDVRRFLNLPDQGGDQGEGSSAEGKVGMGASIPVAVVVRVSGQRQTRKRGENAECSSFDSQKARLIEFLETDERFRGKALAVKFYEGRGVSGLRFDAPHLTSLIQDILSGRYRGGVILAVDQSRVLRFGSALIGTIAKEFGAEVIFANPQAADSDLTTDILDILTFYTAKASGRKSSLVTTKKIGAQTLEWAAKQQRNGVSIRSIYAQLRKDSLNRCERGRTFSYRTLARALGTNADVLNAALSGEAENSFRDFVKAKMSRRKGSDAVLTRSQVMGAYSAYCGEQNLPVVSTQTIVKTWKQLGGKITRPNNQTRYVGFVFSPCLES